MPELKENRMSVDKTADGGLKSLFIIGAAAPLATIASYLTESLFMIFGGEPYPGTVEAWFSLFNRHKILGLFYLNAPDILSISLLGLMFLALYRALRHINKTGMTIASFFAFLGIGVFVTTRSMMLSVLALSGQYASAASDAQRALILAAGQTLGDLGNPTPQTTGFFFMAAAVIIISIVMFRSKDFGKITAFAGILAGSLTVADDLGLVLIPSVSGILMGIAGGFWLLWWIMVSIGLFRLGRIEKNEISPAR